MKSKNRKVEVREEEEEKHNNSREKRENVNLLP